MLDKDSLREAIAERQYRVRIMPGRVICADCLGGSMASNVGVDAWQFVKHLLRSAVCWHMDDSRPQVPFVSKVDAALPARERWCGRAEPSAVACLIA
jgi:hypothetical protein